MELFHTSTSEITQITTTGRFGEFLCFSSNVYSMSAGGFLTYKLEIDESEIIEAGSLFYHENAAALSGIVAQVMQLANCDEDTAEELLSQREDCGDAEMSWDIQALTAEAAKRLGFRGVSMSDEQGTCYMIDMLGRESELQHINE